MSARSLDPTSPHSFRNTAEASSLGSKTHPSMGCNASWLRLWALSLCILDATCSSLTIHESQVLIFFHPPSIPHHPCYPCHLPSPLWALLESDNVPPGHEPCAVVHGRSLRSAPSAMKHTFRVCTLLLVIGHFIAIFSSTWCCSFLAAIMVLRSICLWDRYHW